MLDNVDNKETGAVLRGLRERHGRHLTPTRLSERSGVSRSHISRIESGGRDLTLAVAMRLAPHLVRGDETVGDVLRALGVTQVPAGELDRLAEGSPRARLRAALADFGLSVEEQDSLERLIETMAKLARPSAE